MDARQRLRRYLEQRRDSGETELILDAMPVDEVMRVLGAMRAPSGADATAASAHPRDAGTRRDAAEAPSRDLRGTLDAAPPADWREALRATDGGTPADRAAASRATPPRGDAERAPAPEPPHLGSAPASLPAPPPVPSRTDARDGAQASSPQSHATMPFEQIPAGIVVGSAAHEIVGDADTPYRTLDDVAAAAAACRLCTLYRTAKQAVPGEGNPNAGLVCVGEAPGANEDEQGRPFVGQAGQLLTKILAAIDLRREDVFICNVLKHRPPGNRNPLPEEVAACSPYLVRQIAIIRPRVIVAFGTFAAQTLLQTKDSIGKLRGRIHRYHGVPLLVTYHPAALLRNPAWKRPTWEDVQLARRLLDRAHGT